MNRLANESSPYLRQHADNPVDWYPWSDEAFKQAHQQDKPILLSVGYSSCHWCHVMAHESFEDEATAAVMNELFINIKVDREERPDIDAIYMEAVQAISGQGGWPMTVFLTPDGQPFFAGTYYPPQSQAGRPGFVDLLHAVHQAWTTEREHVAEQATELKKVIEGRTLTSPVDTDIYAHGKHWLDHAIVNLESAYDKEWGGFGRAPKFPQTMALELLLQFGKTEIVTNSLDAMASGGIYDHIGGGFHRYSVDAFWMVPHFEKMLYDQAALARIYLHTFQATGEQRFAQVATETIEYVLRDLQCEAGGWYSAEDADSEGEEGTFYIWRIEDIPTEAHLWYGVTKAGNFEGCNILHRPVRGDLIRPEIIEDARQYLFEQRAKRVRPSLDDKILTEWNAMFLATLAEAAVSLNRTDWLTSAIAAAEFLLSNLRRQDGRWLRSWQANAGAQHLAYANDYAWLVEAFTRLGEATGSARWRALAIETADEMLNLFWDEEHGGLFTSGSDAKQLIVKAKDIFDGATASANSSAAVALARLNLLTGDGRYKTYAEKILQLVADPLSHHPTAFANMCLALSLLAADSTETVIAGKHPKLVEVVQQSYTPLNVLLWGERDHLPLWEGRNDGAYVCRNQVCNAPTTDPNQLQQLLAWTEPDLPKLMVE